MAHIYDPDPADLRNKLQADFDFKTVTRELLARDEDAQVCDIRQEATGLTYREAIRLVRQLELAAYGRRSRHHCSLHAPSEQNQRNIRNDPSRLQELARSYAATSRRKLLHRRLSEAAEYQGLAAEVYAEARTLLGLTSD